MKISVITVTYNARDTIRETIESVLGQNYNDIEYIIVDGRSTDGTLELISSYGSRINKVISEKDQGIYDAMNKGLKAASGEVVGFLNADDIYSSPDVIARVAAVFRQNRVDCCYGDLVYVERTDINKIVRYWKSRPYQSNAMKRGWYPPHPTFFMKRELFKRFGGFNLKFRISGDYELILRYLEKYRVPSHYLPEVMVKMRLGGASNKSLINIIKANIECYLAWKENGLPISIWGILLKPLNKVWQYLGKNKAFAR